jgi:hypothetical protein
LGTHIVLVAPVGAKKRCPRKRGISSPRGEELPRGKNLLGFLPKEGEKPGPRKRFLLPSGNGAAPEKVMPGI